MEGEVPLTSKPSNHRGKVLPEMWVDPTNLIKVLVLGRRVLSPPPCYLSTYTGTLLKFLWKELELRSRHSGMFLNFPIATNCKK